MTKLPAPIKFEWDQANIDKNWEKHKVYFREVEEVFFNKPIKIFPDTKHSGKEKRFVALGSTNKEKKLTIVFTIRNNKIRIISARAQSRKERSHYDKKI